MLVRWVREVHFPYFSMSVSLRIASFFFFSSMSAGSIDRNIWIYIMIIVLWDCFYGVRGGNSPPPPARGSRAPTGSAPVHMVSLPQPTWGLRSRDPSSLVFLFLPHYLLHGACFSLVRLSTTCFFLSYIVRLRHVHVCVGCAASHAFFNCFVYN